MGTCKCGEKAFDDGLCYDCLAVKQEKEDAEALAKLRAKVTTEKPFGVLGMGFGRAWDSWIDTFATLNQASEFIRDRWQGEEYMNSDTGFHTDYSTYELIGFTLADVGLPEANPAKAHLRERGEACCVDDSCEGSHCRVCGQHAWGSFDGSLSRSAGFTCSFCSELTPEDQEIVRAAKHATLKEIYPECYQ